MKKKNIILIVVGSVFAGFCGFVFLLAIFFVVADDAEREVRTGKLIIAVRHKMFYLNAGTVSKKQCVQPEVAVCRTEPQFNREKHRVYAENCVVKSSAPQPFFRQPDVSEIEEYEFEIEPNENYYWYVYLDSEEACGAWLPEEYERFQTGKILLAEKETKRVEADLSE